MPGPRWIGPGPVRVRSPAIVNQQATTAFACFLATRRLLAPVDAARTHPTPRMLARTPKTRHAERRNAECC